jgi:hypothetical protein
MSLRLHSRLLLTADDVAQALNDAGFELRSQDMFSHKYLRVADALSTTMRSQMRRELKQFTEETLWEEPNATPTA